jgi:glycosyltransferase involved in cell wall biosynthesis
VILSIIIPTFNRAGLIKYTLDSLGTVYHPGVSYEVIVVDDGSTDHTWSFIQNEYPHVRLLKNDKKGAAAARNMGLRNAAGKYIMYLDSDDLAGPGYFAQKIELLESNPEVTACYGAYDFFESDDVFSTQQIIFRHKYPMLTGNNNSKQHLINFLSGNFIPPHAIIWQRKFLVAIGGHDEALAINQDVELFIRAILKGAIIMAKDDGTSVYVRSHQLDNRVGDPKNAANKWQQILDLRKKILHELAEYGYDEPATREALSNYLFGYWRMLRHSDALLATAYLNFAKEVFWPVKIRGNVFFRFLSVVLGPAQAVKTKYFLIKRD